MSDLIDNSEYYTDFDITVARGDGYDLAFTVTNPDTSPVNLSSYSMWFTAKTDLSLSDAQATFQLTKAGNAIEVTVSGGNNTGFVHVLGSHTSTLTRSQVLWCDLQIKSGSDEPKTVARGVLRVIADVTRA